ncbi:DUF6624 domain-containing protein [Alteromonas lipolytica]|uniref:Uncharacterized protein n=1 Tax=Alteromonas lipolytica TaxID=1856405 RepID=A0A1E8FHQ3_9ALTE|nr:DUF6624 domain-containing protein [Alteromonas lipolytica]OFI35138.1 hypothetical protein BFC17_16470 [Alteromonas lipolytica]GGF57014.1 hypothetical protein GCM10011338_06610 [Alteromonas lipolytica]
MRFILLVLIFSFPVAAVTQPDLQQELLAMTEADQAIRQQITEAGWDNPPAELMTQMAGIDAQNTERLKQIIAQYSWVTPELVGKKGVSSAFLIIQHSPDYAFQEAMLPILKQAFLQGEGIDGQDFALLTDRVLVHRGEPQIYGTQLNIIDDALVFDPIKEPASVDARRAEVGLPPLEEYIRLLEDAYGLKVK